MEEKFYYRKLQIYQKARVLVKEIYLLLKKYPKEENYALCDQIRRAIISVPSNIVEGISRTSDKEKLHFVTVAYASLMEVLCQMELSIDLGYIDNSEFEKIESLIFEESIMINSFKNKLVK